jgi:hypothetical protein
VPIDRRDDFISASELAQMGYCERRIDFDGRFGPRDTSEQRKAKERGLASHADFYEESKQVIAASARKGYCFIATAALGDSEETRALRAFRDLCLRRTRRGRWLIAAYYRFSPWLCRCIERRPLALAVVRALLKKLASIAAKAVDRHMNRRG